MSDSRSGVPAGLAASPGRRGLRMSGDLHFRRAGGFGLADLGGILQFGNLDTDARASAGTRLDRHLELVSKKKLLAFRGRC